MFQSKKNTGDYHNEMNSERLMGIIHIYLMLYTSRFEEWFKDTLLPNIDPNSLIVMDNASYHSQREEQMPIQNWNKSQLTDWLKNRGLA